MSIIRTSHNKENPYVMLNKGALEDKNISWAAKGLWAYLMSRPDDWTISVSHLIKIYDGYGGGEKAIYNLLNELINHGYCTRTQSKNEEGKFERTEYIITEFKIILPQPLLRDAVSSGAEKDPTTNKGYILNKETTTTEASPLGAAFSSKKKEGKPKPPDPKILECLISLDIPEEEKINLSRLNPEDVQHAVDYATHPEVKVKTTLIQAIKWAIAKKPELPNTKVQDNKKIALKAKETLNKWVLPKNVKVSLYSKYLEIDASQGMASGNYQPKIIDYSESGFIEQLENTLRKLGCRPK